MKLLFDQNLSPRLVTRLAERYPDSAHTDLLGLGNDDDRIVWDYAQRHGFLIVTKDSNFSELVVFLGFPPKVICRDSGGYAANGFSPSTAV